MRWSLKVNRSSWVSAVKRSGAHDGTVIRSPSASSNRWPASSAVPRPRNTCQTAEPVLRWVLVVAPARSRCISVRSVGRASPPVIGLVNLMAAWPGSYTPG